MDLTKCHVDYVKRLADDLNTYGAPCAGCGCGRPHIRTTWKVREMEYGTCLEGFRPVKIRVWVPWRKCLLCKIEWLDHVAEEIQTKAMHDRLVRMLARAKR